MGFIERVFDKADKLKQDQKDLISLNTSLETARLAVSEQKQTIEKNEVLLTQKSKSATNMIVIGLAVGILTIALIVKMN